MFDDEVERDRELLRALLRRHAGELPTRAWCALAAAADELTDPLALPALSEVPAVATQDLAEVLREVRGRLHARSLATGGDAGVGQAAAAARAARQLGQVQAELAAAAG